MLRHFHDLVLSYEVKAMKPQPEIYQAALDMAGCRPEECFYTDDIAAYVEGAQADGNRRGAVRIGGADGAGVARAGHLLVKKAGRLEERRPVEEHL